LVKAIFSHKRKTLINSVFASGGLGLEKVALEEILQGLKIARNCRAEQLSLEQIGKLSDKIHDLKN
ncbi:MAG: 16S rRNA (adenine(1518)-N(6)/adenine(1519)-N(6))-dimethyltransferase, partial [Candidatus Omnitrophica bacterium]|nr:16S rRNA (adenine(1518)-N(6)/adenine(1519)-N(6))-dimethyltransferase [Candidatus Omnitrophota bacterium]